MSVEPNEDLPVLRAALARIDAWFAVHRPHYSAALHPGATVAELAALERALGLPLPAALHELLAWHNGQSADFAGCFVEHWFLMSCENIRLAYAETTGWIPFLDNDAGDYLCLDAARTPCPVRAFYLSEFEQPIVAPSLASWMQAFADDLEAGHYVEDPERGDLMRKQI